MSFAKAQKRQREKARQEKAAIKRQRRLERGDETGDEPNDEPGAAHDAPAEGDVLAELAALHASFEAEEIPFEEFEERKQELLARLAV